MDDQKKVEILRTAYEEMVKKERDNIKLMLEDGKLLAIVQDLNDKYSLRITEVRNGIFNEYEWFKEK